MAVDSIRPHCSEKNSSIHLSRYPIDLSRKTVLVVGPSALAARRQPKDTHQAYELPDRSTAVPINQSYSRHGISVPLKVEGSDQQGT